MQAGGFLDYLGILIVFCAILFLAWLTTRLIGRRFAGDVRNRRMQVVETLPLGMDRSLLLVRVGQRHYLLATGRGRTDFMAEVDPGPEPEADASSPNDFRTILERYSGLGRQRERTGPSEDGAETTGLQSGIQRLRRMNGSAKGENHPHG